MARDLSSIAHVLGGTLCLADRVAASTPVDAAVKLDEFAVAGHPSYATLVVGSAEAIGSAVRADDARTAALAPTVLVVGSDPDGLQDMLSTNGFSAIIMSESNDELLHARLVALLAADQAAEDRLVTTGTKVLTRSRAAAVRRP